MLYCSRKCTTYMARRNHELSMEYQSREDKWSNSSLITDYSLKLRKIQEVT